jgi:hypothetical protein
VDDLESTPDSPEKLRNETLGVLNRASSTYDCEWLRSGGYTDLYEGIYYMLKFYTFDDACILKDLSSIIARAWSQLHWLEAMDGTIQRGM